MLPQALFSLLLVSPPAPIPDQMVQTLDLGRLTFRDAKRLEGQAVRVSFVVDSLPDVIDGETLVDAEGKASASRSVRFVRGVQAAQLEPGQALVVEGIVRPRIVPAW